MDKRVLSVSGLSKNYESPVLNNINFELNQGESIALVGANGAGKSTLLKILLSFTRASKGTFQWFPERELTDFSLKQKISYLPEGIRYWGELKVFQVLSCLAQLRKWKKSEAQERAESVLHVFGLKNRADKRCHQLSKGMRQRLALAQLFFADSEVFVMDEPMSGLDPQAQEKLRIIVKKYRDRGKSFLIATHHIEDIRKLCSRVILLEKGKIILDAESEKAIAFIREYYSQERPWEEDPLGDEDALF